jgi:P27 family predicted phage terminase small subunit
VSESTGNSYQNPWYHVANREWEKLRKMLPEFGLTPSARSRLTIEQEEEEDELAALLFRRRTAVSE